LTYIFNLLSVQLVAAATVTYGLRKIQHADTIKAPSMHPTSHVQAHPQDDIRETTRIIDQS